MFKWLKDKVKAMSENELCDLYSEIVDFQETGLFVDGTKLKELVIESNKKTGSNVFNTVEETVLLEIGRRYSSMILFDSGEFPKKGDDIWYVDFENGVLEHGKVFIVTFQDGKLDTFSINFDDGTFDVFDGSGFNNHYFINKKRAEAKLLKGQD